ncbi:hypothetical protein RJ55_07287 [Drechmeria coniospora]|nr:hypothetical protein RJ55_07287 [Drechmeria coniospora]
MGSRTRWFTSSSGEKQASPRGSDAGRGTKSRFPSVGKRLEGEWPLMDAGAEVVPAAPLVKPLSPRLCRRGVTVVLTSHRWHRRGVALRQQTKAPRSEDEVMASTDRYEFASTVDRRRCDEMSPRPSAWRRMKHGVSMKNNATAPRRERDGRWT